MDNNDNQNDSLDSGAGKAANAANAVRKGAKVGKKLIKLGAKAAGTAAKKWLLIAGGVVLCFLLVLSPLVALYNSAVSFFLPVIRIFNSHSYDYKFYSIQQAQEDMQVGYVDLGDELADDFAEFWSGTKGEYKVNEYNMKEYSVAPVIEYTTPDGTPSEIVKGMMQMFCVKEMYGMCHPDIIFFKRGSEDWAESDFKKKYGEHLLDFTCKKKKERLSDLFDDYMHVKKGKKYKETMYMGDPTDPNTKTLTKTYQKFYITIESDEQYLADHPFESKEEEEYYKQFQDKAVQKISSWDETYLEGVYYGFKSTDHYSGGGVFGYVAPNLTKGKYKIEGNGWDNIVKNIMPEIIRAYKEHPNAKMLPSVCLGQYYIESGHHDYSWDGDGANGFGIDIDGDQKPGEKSRFEYYPTWHDLINAYYDFFEYTNIEAKKIARKQTNPYVQIYWIEEANYCTSSPKEEYRTKVSQVIYDLGLSRFDKCITEGISPEEAVKLPIDYNETPPASASVNITPHSGVIDQTACAANQKLAAFAWGTDKVSKADLIKDGMSPDSSNNPWCTYYVTYLMRRTGAYPDLPDRTTGGAEALHKEFKSSSAYYYHKVEGNANYTDYTPRAGDILFFAGSPVKPADYCHHTAVVVSYDRSTNMIQYANGNCSNDDKAHVYKVKYKPYPYGKRDTNTILGLGTTKDKPKKNTAKNQKADNKNKK